MNKKVSIGALITLMIMAAAVTFSMTFVFSMRKYNDMMYNLGEREALYSKISEIDKVFRTTYPGAIDEKILMDAISSGYAKGSGDAYARYYTKEAYQKESMTQEGRVKGIGVVTEKDSSGYLLIKDIYPGSTAAQSGIKIGDLIVSIDETEVSAENATQMQELLQGEAGTKVNLIIRRENEDLNFDEVTRRDVDIPSVFPKMMANNIGYLRISTVSDTTDEQFIKQLGKQIEEGAKGFIIDVRGNNGGIFASAVKMLDRILPPGQVATATYKNGKVDTFETTDSKELNMPIVFITNEKTAREAEIIAQVLKDYGKAKTVGAKSMGKGTKQDIVKLTDGSALLLTTAVYQTPNSDTFNLVGVKPDYEVKLTAEEEKKFAANELDENTDPQIVKAIEVAQGLMRAAQEAPAAQEAATAKK